MNPLVGWALGLVVVAELILLLGGQRVLISEQRIHPWQEMTVPEYGLVKGDNLVCEHFTGRSIITTVYAFSPNDIMGKSECPFIYKP